jgi:sortase A
MTNNDDRSTNNDQPTTPKHGKVLQPLSDDLSPASIKPAGDPANPAVELLRRRVESLYSGEPDAKQELAEVEAARKPLSKHQRYMLSLSGSGKSLAEIQTAWHNYYQELSDKEKHEVWQEFYKNHALLTNKNDEKTAADGKNQAKQEKREPAAASQPQPGKKPKADSRTAADIRKQLLHKVGNRKTVRRGGPMHSLMFGMGMGLIVILIFMFGFFNERFIAPFITPSKSVSNTPIIIDPNSSAAGPEPKIIIPKINVDIPVVYDEPSIDEKAVQRALEDGVLHYGTTSDPGELGNAVVFGHSSNNILNRGKYKFAFVLLNRLEPGDTFMLQKDGKRYVYKVFEKKVVNPRDVSVLDPVPGKAATATLITCDPPGTTINRLVVIGEQISPDPEKNVASSATKDAPRPDSLPSEAPSLWQRLMSWLSS